MSTEFSCIRRTDTVNVISTTDAEPRSSFLCCPRCNMPSLSKMPLAARNLVTNLFGFLQSNQNSHNNLNEKSNKFSTPQVDRKNKVNLDRRNSDSKVPPEKMTKRVHIQNVEKWEPNVYEKELLRRTWSDEFDFLYQLGSAIYFYIFEHNPNCKTLFPFIDRYEAENKNWKESKEFRGQALRFVQTLSQVVKNLYHMDRLEPYLYQIGQRHCKYADRGFKHEYWDIFQDAMENSLEDRMSSLTDLDTQQKSDAITVWRTLALFVVVHMKAGFLDGLKGINRFPPLV